jgi:hypothetical protein
VDTARDWLIMVAVMAVVVLVAYGVGYDHGWTAAVSERAGMRVRRVQGRPGRPRDGR